MENNKGIVNFAKKIMTGINRFWHKGFFAKLLVIFVVLGCVNGIYSVKKNISDTIEKSNIHKQTYIWPNTELSGLITKPEWENGIILIDNESELRVEIYDRSENDFNSYIDLCKEKGFVEKHNSTSYGSSKRYDAENNLGFRLSVEYYIEDGYFDKDSMIIHVQVPNVEKEKNDKENEVNNPNKETNSSKEMIDGMRKSFVEAMNSYEDFFDEYIEFMEEYNNSTDTLSMLNDYSEFMEKYADTMEKMSALEDDNLNDKELAYYIKVTGRINEKLLTILE